MTARSRTSLRERTGREQLTQIAYLDTTSPAANLLAARHGTTEDQRFADQHRHPTGQRQRLMVRVLLRALLARHYPVPAEPWKILRADDGAPYLEMGRPGLPAPFISLSHSGDLVACAIGSAAVGIDVERIRPDRPVTALAGTAFGPLETAAVEAAGSDGFYRIWTLREALAKATGAGFGMLMNRTDLVPPTPDAPAPHQDVQGRAWNFAYWRLPEGYGLGLVRLASPAGDAIVSPLGLHDLTEESESTNFPPSEN
ncbi:MAG TPA: 4'-phosphopantetheinyl transferase superfamily protein [Aliidongia sp.]|uniref:4'-phosphopantetheinyl transferase family protein n=1 Tax=Aliidongia sp. TaxID=1914230 RepID=UPI002DDD3248|nr:4'-phosphopantetheinyl transferase superfamily protein [Aliidongia sp.]HEV2676097.1 4'-phosphopantetheinyl transferase superfamily protein [Aliidongia sp.]